VRRNMGMFERPLAMVHAVERRESGGQPAQHRAETAAPRAGGEVDDLKREEGAERCRRKATVLEVGTGLSRKASALS